MSETHTKPTSHPSAGSAEDLDARVDAMLKEMDATTERISHQPGTVLDPAPVPTDSLISDDSSPTFTQVESPPLDSLLADVAAELASQTSLVQEVAPSAELPPDERGAEPVSEVRDTQIIDEPGEPLAEAGASKSPVDLSVPTTPDVDPVGAVAQELAAGSSEEDAAVDSSPVPAPAVDGVDPSIKSAAPVEEAVADPIASADVVNAVPATRVEQEDQAEISASAPAATAAEAMSAVSDDLTAAEQDVGLDAELAAAAEQLAAEAVADPLGTGEVDSGAGKVTTETTPELAAATEAAIADIPAVPESPPHTTDSAARTSAGGHSSDSPGHPPIEQLDQVLAQEAETVLAQSGSPPREAAEITKEVAPQVSSAAEKVPEAAKPPETAPVASAGSSTSPATTSDTPKEQPSEAKVRTGPTLGQRLSAVTQRALMPLARRTASLPDGTRQTLGWIAVVTLLQSAALWGYPLVRGPAKAPEPTSNPAVFLKPGEKAPEHKPRAGDHGDTKAAESHGSAKDSGHGSKESDSHGAKKDDGHGAKKEDSHGAKKETSHGAEKKKDAKSAKKKKAPTGH